MAKFFFDANSYPTGTLISSLGFVFRAGSNTITTKDFEVTEIGATGRKYWNLIGNAPNGEFLTLENLVGTEQSVVIICDYTQVEVPPGVFLSPNPVCLYDAIARSHRILLEGDGDPTYYVLGMGTKSVDNPPTGWLAAKATAARADLVGNDIYMRSWQADVGGLAAAEPSTWNTVASKNAVASGTPAIGLGGIYGGPPIYAHFTAIGFGTDGDLAPTEAPPTPIVATPTNLQTTNITHNSARFTWN